MQTRKLGAQGPAVSAIGLGCMGMSDFYGSKASRDDAESLATIGAALDAGITLLDTGDFYGMGHNEALVAKGIAGRREGVLERQVRRSAPHAGPFSASTAGRRRSRPSRPTRCSGWAST